MKILLSALGCEPGRGSELEVGFRALLAAASRHEVWLLTNSATVPVVRRAIENYPWAHRVHLEGIFFEVDDELYARLSASGFHRYYDRWQRLAAARAAELDRHIDFDIVHHVTLAAHWPRAGATVVDKPLVFGPVGGGVEMPLSLIMELGWRGVLEEAGRVVGRRLLARIGPARLTQRQAVVTFAQNTDTARIIRTDGRVRVLPNATSVDVCDTVANGPRRHDIIFAARLLPWKGGRLAVRSLRYVQRSDAVLRIFGDGPERQRILRAARRWGLADRVHLEGRVPRDELMRLVATAGVFLHTAFHDEAGLAVAEALSLATPVVCLDRGGPPELLRHWPDADAMAVKPESPDRTARALAGAIDRFLSDPPPVVKTPRRAVTSFEEELLSAYDVAFAAGRERVRKVWAFPAGKPQVFADTPRALSKGVMVYGFGRRLPRWAQTALAFQVRVPLLRRLLAERRSGPTPVCGWPAWRAVFAQVQRRDSYPELEWVHFHSQWDKPRASALGLDPQGASRVFVTVEAEKNSELSGRFPSAPSFHSTACIGSFSHAQWAVREYEPLPRFHRPAGWNAERIRRVADDVSRALELTLQRPSHIPSHWRAMHGDYVPWNLREDGSNQLWLVDWEDTGWGPPFADLVRYIVAYHSLGWSSPATIARIVTRTLRGESNETLLEVARFWLAHPNLQARRHTRRMTRREAQDVRRATREIAALRILASRAEEAIRTGQTPLTAVGGR